MAVGGTKRESNFKKSVGFFEGKVLAVNPTKEELEKMLGTEIEKDIDYTSEDGDGNARLKLNFRVQDVKTKAIFNLGFLLTDKDRTNKEETKTQYINTTGATTWADEEANLQGWFTKYEYRVAKSGEDDLYNFVRTWSSGSDWMANTEFFNWKKLMRGNVDELKDILNSDLTSTVLFMATVSSQEKDGEIKEYQQIYNKFFTYGSIIKSVRLAHPETPEYLEKALKIYQHGTKEEKKKLNGLQRFVLNLEDEQYGCKDFFVRTELKEYDPSENIVSENKEDKSEVKTGTSKY